MNAERMVGQDEPLMIAWNAYKATEDYANSRKWAEYKEHLDGSLWAVFCAGYAARDEEIRKQEPMPKGFIVVSKDLLAEAIACNTDASLAEARHIINSVLKVSDDEIFREVLKEESK